jgi:hypothetical protein
MTQKNTALSVRVFSREMGITPMAGKGGFVPSVGTLSVGVMPELGRPTNKSGSDVGSSRVTLFGSWLIKAGIVRESFTV